MASHRILIVDDEPLNRDYLEQELEDRGYRVVTAADGRQALELVAADPPDLILLDVVMPRMDGIEVCRRLKDDPETRLIPIIIMTALTAREDRVKGIEVGADDFLTKPVDEQELHGRINGALRLKEAIDRKLHELASASERLEQLGTHDEDLAVVIAVAADDAARRLHTALEAGGGVAAAVQGASVAAVFRGADPIARARAAADAVRGAAPTNAAIGMAVGSALIGSERASFDGANRWVLTAEGPAVASALEYAGVAAPGQVLVGDQVRDQLGTAYPASPVTTADGAELFDLGWTPAATARGVFELEFPADYSELLPTMRRIWAVEDLYLTRALSGLSGARVYAVDIDCAGHSGQAILKLERVNPAWSEEQEADRHRHAVARNEAYAASHLPRVLHVLRHGDAVATLSTIAAGGLEYCLAWFRAPYELQLEAGPRVMRDVLESWNAGYDLAPGLVSPVELLDHWLGYRLDPVEGRLDALLRDELGLDPQTPTFLLAGHWYPNPVAFARGVGVAPPLRAAIGQMHGDMHGFNVLTSQRRSDVSDYFLIDLAFYQDDSFLLFDHGYFELAYLLRTREDADASRWIDLLNALFRGGGTTADDVGVVRLVEALRGGAQEWIHEHEDHRLSYMMSQMMLGRIGAGLNFANKRIALNLRLNSLLYAATALKDYIKVHGLDWPRSGQVLTPPETARGGGRG